MTPKKVITFGEIMMRLSAPAFARFTQTDRFQVLYAGSEANVAASLAILGVPAAHVTRFPDTDLGVAATQSLMRCGVEVQHIVYGDGRLGIYFLENGAMQRSSKIIYDRFDSAFARITTGEIDWSYVFQDAQWFHWTGITPAISQGAADVCAEAILAARKSGLTVSGDINYRRNLWQYGKSATDVMPGLIEMTDIIVGGTTDFENCLNISEKNFEKACQQVMRQFPVVKKLTSTHRESISSSHNKINARLWNGKQLLTSATYDLTHIVDRVGTGDAYMAGLIYKWIHQQSDQQAIEFGIAASALKHSIEGDVNLATAEEIELLVKGENVGKLLR
ncbi:MAG: sugar kinase [Cytophagales bacterium]|nr:sugar kinase [Cytophagales bacterium]